MSLGISARLKYPKKHELVKSHSQSQILASKLRQDGTMGTVENVMQAVDQVAALLSSANVDPTISYKDSIINLYQHLKVYGAYLEILYQDQLNRAFVVFRNSSQDDVRLDYLSRLHLLELIELRAKQWKGSDLMNQYYRKKANQCAQCTLIRIVPVFRQTGSVGRQEGGGRPKVRTEEVIGNVREIMTDAPKTSVRTLAQQTGLSVGSCHKVLKEDLQLFPYRITCLQEILDIDYPRRVVFCEWFTNNFNDDIEASESAGSLTESMSSGTIASPPLLGPGEILKPSGKFSKPTRIPGKNYCKDEVVIRNADSGKVMGIKGRRVHMIEELSETIISFQRVNPGAKERLVQITGANEESINHAKQLIEDTIRRNASPVREHSMAIGGPLTGSSSSINSSASDESALPHAGRSRALLHSLSTNDANIGEYKYTVVTGGHTIKITGDDLDLVRISKLVLDEYFSGEPIQDIGQFYSFDSLPQTGDVTHEPLSPPDSLPSPSVVANGQVEETPETPPLRRPHTSIEEIIKGKTSPELVDKKPARFMYSIEFLARLAMSPFCLVPPIDLERISNEQPTLVRKLVEMFDAKQYLSNRLGDQMVTVLSADEVDTVEV